MQPGLLPYWGSLWGLGLQRSRGLLEDLGKLSGGDFERDARLIFSLRAQTVP
jgi:hypothetical protein